MIPRFFIDRPIFAAVLSVFITLAGAVSLTSLSVAQYPDIAPPTIQIDCNYPGASALVVSQSIAAPIEQQVNGVEDMLYMNSQCTSDGSYTCTITFKPGSDLNMAQVRVQNRVNLATSQLPDVVRATGVTTRKRSPELLLTVGITSPPDQTLVQVSVGLWVARMLAIGQPMEYRPPEGPYDQLFLSNYAVLKLREELQRLPGISDVTVFGQRDYAIRFWLDPDRLAGMNLAAPDVVNAIRQQNLPLASGQVGQPPMGSSQPYQFTLDGVGRLSDPVEFGKIVVKVGPEGQLVRVRDVCRKIELGARLQDVANRFDDKPTVGLAIFVLPDSNALVTRDAVKETMDRLSKNFPPGIKHEIGYDTTPFIRESIEEVFFSLRDAIILVSIVVLLFLQSWRAAAIPLAAVPVAIVGTFAAMAAVGFSVNLLTLFGLILAVGIVVDDAIVVVEAVQHQLELGFMPREATIRAMDHVTSPIIAVGVVLSFVFFPCVFISGIVGMFFKQFALTIAASTLISTFNSLTLSPALCALLLQPKTAASRKQPLPKLAGAVIGIGLASLAYLKFFPIVGALTRTFGTGDETVSRLHGFTDRVMQWLGTDSVWVIPVLVAIPGGIAGWFLVNRVLAGIFALFEWAFKLSGRAYVKIVGLCLRVPLIVLIGYVGVVGAGVVGFQTMPTGFIPQQDKGYLVCSIQLPDAASAERTQAVISEISRIAMDLEIDVDGQKVKPIVHVNAIAGNSFVLSAYGSNFGSMFVILDSFEKRRSPKLTADAIAAKLRDAFAAAMPEAQLNVFGAPAVPRLGRAGGFRIMIEDRGDIGPEMLQAQTQNLIDQANRQPQLVGLFTVFKTNSPQIYLDVDPGACVSRGLEVSDVYSLLQGTMGSRYANDFNRFGRTWQVNVQSDPQFRNQLDDVKKLKVRNKAGEMVPLGAVLVVKEKSGPLVITRYNMYPAAAVNGNIAPGTSTGDGIGLLEKLAERELPDRMAYEWTELTFLEKQSRNTGAIVFGLSVVFVFLVLAALYESWAFPLAVILVVPVCVACSLAAVWLTDPLSAEQTVVEWNRWLGDQGIPSWFRLNDWSQRQGNWLDDGPIRKLNGDVWRDTGPIKVVNEWLFGLGVGKQDVNVFTQVGFVVLIGLACKNAILIVEFAKVARDRGVDLRTAVLDACKLRYRPIMMTSVAFMLGVLPLAVARGAGAEMRQAIGVAVLGGMLGVTIFGIVLTPVFFAVVDRITRSRLASHPWVVALHHAGLYLLRFKFVPPLVRFVRHATSAAVKRLRVRRPANPM